MNNSNDHSRWIEHLKRLPKYQLVVDKLVLGTSPGVIVDWLMQDSDRGPLSGLSRSTLRLYLIRLNVKLTSNSRKNTKHEGSEHSRRLNQPAYEFPCGPALRGDPAAPWLEAIAKEIKAVEIHCPTSTIDNMTSDELARFVVRTHLTLLDEMAEWEEQLMMPHPEWECTMEALLSAIKILHKSESTKKHSAMQSKTNISISEPRDSSQQDSVD
jgi:hypothetical protein